MKVYFSAPQNTSYQREYVQARVEELRAEGFEVYLASDKYINHQPAFEVTAEMNGKPLYSDKDGGGRLEKSHFAQEVFAENYAKLVEADVLVALLDGSQVDDRVACEIGIFYGLSLYNPGERRILGFASDARCLRRSDSTFGVNIFTVGTLEEIGNVFDDFDGLVSYLKDL